MSPLATVCHRHRTLVPVGERCGECAREDSRRRGDRNVRNGVNLAGWRGPRGLRARKLRRNPICELDYAGCTGKATTVHVPPELEGDHRRARLDELVSACAHCHGVEDGPRAHAARRR